MPNIKNLYEETNAELVRNDRKWDDIVAVQGFGVRISVEKFIELAKQTNYDAENDVGIARDIILILKDGSWFERTPQFGVIHYTKKIDECWRLVRKPDMLRSVEDDRVTSLIPKRGNYLGD